MDRSDSDIKTGAGEGFAARIPSAALKAIKMLNSNGWEGYLVGGCLRDIMLGLPASDIDIATNALPSQTSQVFAGYGCRLPGERYGTVCAVVGGERVEITTFRRESGYSDKRRPDNVEFCDSLTDDLSRRDFTVNSMAYSPASGLIDIFDGQTDLKLKLMRAVGDPEKRFREDALRTVRLFRLCAKLGFAPQEDTLRAAYAAAGGLSAVAGERLRGEYIAMLRDSGCQLLEQISRSGILAFAGIEGGFSARILSDCPKNGILRLAVLCVLTASSAAECARRLRMSNMESAALTGTAEFLMAPAETKAGFKKSYSLFSDREWLQIQQALTAVSGSSPDIGGFIRQIKGNREPYKLSQLSLGGADLLELGYEGGQIGRLLEQCLEHVIKHPGCNTRDALLKYIGESAGNHRRPSV